MKFSTFIFFILTLSSTGTYASECEDSFARKRIEEDEWEKMEEEARRLEDAQPRKQFRHPETRNRSQHNINGIHRRRHRRFE